MKNIVFVGLLVLAVFNGFFYYKTGSFPLREWGEQVARDGLINSAKNFSLIQTLSHTKQIFTDMAGDGLTPPGKSLQIYKWTDANGVVHYDNQPVKGVESISIDPNANVLPMESAPVIAPSDKAPVDNKQETLENMEKIRAGMEARVGI